MTPLSRTCSGWDGTSINNIGSLEGTLQYRYHATLGEPLLLRLNGNRLHGTEGFFLKNLYCLEFSWDDTSRHIS